MTEIQEQPRSAASASSPDAAATGATGAAASRPAAKGLSSKLLPELQQIAGGLGISTSKKKKADLIAAIQAARNAPPKAETAPRTDAAPRSEASKSEASKSEASKSEASKSEASKSEASKSEASKSEVPRTRERKVSTPRAASAQSDPQPADASRDSTASDAAPVDATASDQPAATRRERPRRERATRPEQAPLSTSGSDATAAAAPGNERQQDGSRHENGVQQGDRNQNDRVQGDRNQNDRAQNGAARADRGAAQNNGGQNNGGDRNGADRNGGQNNGGDRNGADRNGGQNNGGDRNGADRNGAQNGGAQNGGDRNGAQNGGQRTDAARDDDDDFDGRGRRGRRYRDRRGRNRERTVGGSGQNGSAQGNVDVEPTIGEDDVLVPVGGVLDTADDGKGNWYIRVEGYFAGNDDVFVANSFIRRYNLRRGDAVTGTVRQAKDGERREKYNPLVRLDTVNGRDPESIKNRVEFTKLTPLYPQERLRLETEPHILTTRVIDLVMPIGKGQRALIVSPPKAGKTMVLQAIANAIVVNNPEAHLMVVLVDERPEEVTDMQRSVKGEVIASTFDRRPQDHIAVAELSIERAKRLVEMGHDVVVLLDSITRLGRAYNLGAPASGRILSGGVDSTALYQPKRFLGAARNIENGGSLTIIATALVETGSAGDTVFFEEYKGTGNAELKLDRKIADKRIFPAIDVDQSSTRKEELLLSPDELAVTIKLRRVLHSLEQQQAIELLLDRLRKTRTNIEFLMQIAKTTPGGDN